MVKSCAISEPWYKTLHEPKPYAFALLILAGIILELIVHFLFGISIVYTQFFYLIIVVAGLWYGRNAIWIALFFGSLHVAVTYIASGFLSPDSLMRALMFCIVAFVVCIIVEQMNGYRATIIQQNRELIEINTRLNSSQNAFETANKKLNLLSSITRHDIKNQLLALLGFVELSKEKTKDPEMLHFIEREETAAQNIRRQIEFTKNYEDIGVRAPQWQNIGTRLKSLRTITPDLQIVVSPALDTVEVFADPLLEKVFENLIDNSRLHGERVKLISVFAIEHSMGNFILVYEDDGIGVRETDKERIFEKGFGKHTGLGLFLCREILAITGLTLKETGTYGKGVRFEIIVPPGKYRFPETTSG